MYIYMRPAGGGSHDHQNKSRMTHFKRTTRKDARRTVSALLALAGVYRRTARFDEMRLTLDKLYAKMKTEEVAKFIRGVFGYEPETILGKAYAPLPLFG